MTEVVLIGQSPFSALLAEALDKQLGSFAHIKLTWLRPSRGVVHLASQPLLGDYRASNPSKWTGVEVNSAPIRSINLPARRIITESSQVGFDYLLIDQTPAYSPEQLQAIGSEIKKLLATLEARYHTGQTGTARVYCQGWSAEASQLALLIEGEITRHHPKLRGIVEVLVDRPASYGLKNWLADQRVKVATPAKLKTPGLTVEAPRAAFPSSRIKGLRVATNGAAIVNALFSPAGQPNVIVLGPNNQSVLRVMRARARALVRELTREFDGQKRRPLDWSAPALLLKANGQAYVQLGELETAGPRAQLIAQLDSRLGRQFS